MSRPVVGRQASMEGTERSAAAPTGKRLLLVEPPFYRLYKDSYSLTRYPLSLGYLAAVAGERTDWRVRVYNADFVPEAESVSFSHLSGPGFQRYRRLLSDTTAPIWSEVRRRIAEYRPAVVGVTAKSQNYTAALNVAALVREIDPGIAVVFGGPHPSLTGGEILATGLVDYVVVGEGEETFVELLQALGDDPTRVSSAKLESIRGLYFNGPDGPRFNGPREFITDLDSLPYPHEYAAEVLWDHDDYPDYAFRSLMATRGCPYNCFFCGSRNLWSRRVRFRSVADVVRQINSLAAHGIQRVHFEDDTFGVTRSYLRRLCHAMRLHCPGVEWSCETHVNLIDVANLRLMRDAGCVSIQLGVESGSNRVLSDMRKRYTIEDARRAAGLIARHGLELEAFFMVGFITDDEESLAETWWAMKTIPGMISYSIFTPYPGTEAFERCRELGLLDDDYDVSRFNHQSPANCFSDRLEHDRFRRMVAVIERGVDRKNRQRWLRDKLSFGTLRRLRRLGLRTVLRRLRQYAH
ncbi:MAG: radical SAM protein [Candidatus Coatesbacteria bacterium]|nr:radical SAM protein [Candidatus Coatesbacteria bacterium]